MGTDEQMDEDTPGGKENRTEDGGEGQRVREELPIPNLPWPIECGPSSPLGSENSVSR